MSGCPTVPATKSTLTRPRGILPAIAEFRPEVLFYQSGVDGLAGDGLGRLQLTHEGLMERDRAVCAFARERRIPVAITLGRGYADPIARTAEAHANTFRTAARLFARPATCGGRRTSFPM